MADERERRKKLRALVRRVVELQAKITRENAEKIANISEECLPTLFEYLKDENRWSELEENRQAIAPVVAFFLIGMIGSAQSFDEVSSVIRKHLEDFFDETVSGVSSVIASCGIGEGDLMFRNGTRESSSTMEKQIWLESFALTSHLDPSKKDSVESKLVSYLSSGDGNRETTALIITELVNLGFKSSLPVIRDAFASGRVDESIISLKDVEEALTDSEYEGSLNEIYQNPATFFDKENLQLITVGDDQAEDDFNSNAEASASIQRTMNKMF